MRKSLPKYYVNIPNLIADNDIEGIRALLDSGLDVNTIGNENGNTYLIFATFFKLDTVKFLLDYGADPTIKNKYGENFIDKIFTSRRNFYSNVNSHFLNEEMNEILKWISSFETQQKLIDKYPELYSSLKTYNILHYDIDKIYPHLNALNDLKLI